SLQLLSSLVLRFVPFHRLTPRRSLYFLTALPPTRIHALSLHDALPIWGASAQRPWREGGVLQDPAVHRDRGGGGDVDRAGGAELDRKSTRLNSSHVSISYAVFCLKKKKRSASGASL